MTAAAGRWRARRVAPPPLADRRFWIVQAMVLGLAVTHFVSDAVSGGPPDAVPAGIPVALLLVPVSYAALHYGLAGSVATAAWATLLWLPDLLLPNDRGHVGNDLLELGLVVVVAVFIGHHIDAERRGRALADRADAEHRASDVKYRQLFDTNTAPILVLDADGRVLEANPAAHRQLGADPTGRPVSAVLGASTDVSGASPAATAALAAPGQPPREYRVHRAQLPTPSAPSPVTQLVLVDITEERAVSRQATHFASLLLAAQEDERRRIAQELHDEPLQLLVHLARSLEDPPDDGPDAAHRRTRARDQALDIAARIRGIVTGLRPAALDQLGLPAALRGFLASIETSTGRHTELLVTGTGPRLTPDCELALFRIAQEAVSNAVRHAAAHHIRVTLAGSEHEVRLCVVDDGTGFDTERAQRGEPPGRLGLLGMRQRAELLGGRLTLRSSPAHGTRVEVRVPCGDLQAPGEVTAAPITSPTH